MICLTRNVIESIITGVYPYRKTYEDVWPKIDTFECRSVDAQAEISCI